MPMVRLAPAAGYSADGVGAKIRRKARAEWLALMPERPRGLCQLGEGRGDPRDGQQQRPDQPASWRAQARRRLARGADPLPPLRPQADAALYRRPASDPALQLQPRLDGQWRAALHRIRRSAGRRRDRGSAAWRGRTRRGRRVDSCGRAGDASGATRCARPSTAISKRRAMPPTAPSGSTMPPIRPTGWSLANSRRAGTRRSRASPKSRAKSRRMRPRLPAAGHRRGRARSPGANLKTVWSAPTTDARLKKRIVRTLIHEVVADIDDAASEIVIVVHWSGGVHSEIRLPKRRRGQRNSTPADVIAAVRELALIASDDLIAGLLNRNGLKTGHGNRWTRERVTSLRSHHRIPVFKAAADGVEPWLNLTDAARVLKIALENAAAGGRSRRDRGSPSLERWPLDLRSRRTHDGRRQIDRRTRPPQRQNTPRDRSRPAKPIHTQWHRQMGVLMRGCSTFANPPTFRGRRQA